MVAKTNSAGTLSNVFSIGKGGPTIRQGSGIPSSGTGSDGDVYLRYGTSGAYIKSSGDWQLLTPNALPLTGGILTGTLSHQGLILTEGFAIDQVKTFTASPVLTTQWQDTAISGDDLVTGTYILQVTVNRILSGDTDADAYLLNDAGDYVLNGDNEPVLVAQYGAPAGYAYLLNGADDYVLNDDNEPLLVPQYGGIANEYYSGVFPWYDGDTIDNYSTEVVLNHAGAKSGSNSIFLRVNRSPEGDSRRLTLQIAGSFDSTDACALVFKLRRML